MEKLVQSQEAVAFIDTTVDGAFVGAFCYFSPTSSHKCDSFLLSPCPLPPSVFLLLHYFILFWPLGPEPTLLNDKPAFCSPSAILLSAFWRQASHKLFLPTLLTVIPAVFFSAHLPSILINRQVTPSLQEERWIKGMVLKNFLCSYTILNEFIYVYDFTQ